MVAHLAHTALHSLEAASVDAALIDMWCPEQMVELAVGYCHDSAADTENHDFAVAPKCTFASDYVDK